MSDGFTTYDNGNKEGNPRFERGQFDRFRKMERVVHEVPKTVRGPSESHAMVKQMEKVDLGDKDEGPKYSESISEKRSRMRESARKAVLQHVKTWKEQQQNKEEKKDEMDESEKKQKREELLREMYKAEDEAMANVRDPLTSQAYMRESAATADLPEDRNMNKRNSRRWSVSGPGVDQQWNQLERDMKDQSYTQYKDGQSDKSQEGARQSDKSFDNSMPATQAKVREPAEAPLGRAGGRTGA